MIGTERMHAFFSKRRVAAASQKAVDACLVLCLFVAPLWFGGRHDFGRLVYGLLVATATIAWALGRFVKQRPGIGWSRFHTLLVAAVALVGLQLAPVGPTVVGWLTPGLAEIAPAWTPGADFPLQLGAWRTVSVTPSETRVGLALLVSHALLFCLVVERLKSLDDIRRLLTMVAVAASLMAAFGLLQWMTSNGKLLWFYEHPQRAIGESVQGSFANKNHFAHFVTLGVGPGVMALWWALRNRAPKRRSGVEQKNRVPVWGLWLAAVVVEVVAVVMSLSRGAFVALLTAAAVGLFVCYWHGWLRPRRALSLAGVAAAVLFCVSLGDFERIVDRYSQLASGSMEELDYRHGRRSVWEANLAAAASAPWLGYGVGSHADVYHAYMNRGFAAEYTHAESGFLHTTTETGLLGGVLLLAAVATVGAWCLRGVLFESDPGRIAAWAAVTAGLAASLVHSLVDFVWYIPACMSVTLMLVACALRLHQTAPDSPGVRDKCPKWRGWTPVAGAVAMATLATCLLWRPGIASFAWDRYLRISSIERGFIISALSSKADDSRSARETVAAFKRAMIESLEEVVARHPGHARAHLRLAGRRLQQFELSRSGAKNSIGITHVRSAALASRFPSHQATTEWLVTAFGEDAQHLIQSYDHTRAALILAPLQGDAYGYLADLCYLSPPDQRNVNALMQQAVLLRPYDGGILFESGKQALLAGQVEQAINLWKRAHLVHGAHRLQIAALLATRVPAEEYLKAFEPDWETLPAVLQRYREKNDEADLRALADYAVGIGDLPVESRVDARRREAAWRLASSIERDLGDLDAAVDLAERAAATPQPQYATRRCLAAAYYTAGRHEDAAPHLRWCLSRKPGDRQAQDWLLECCRNRVASKVANSR